MPPLTFCPICHWHDWWTLARLTPLKVVRCGGCDLVALHQQPTVDEIQNCYDETYFRQEMGGYYLQYQAFLRDSSLPLPYTRLFKRFQDLIQEAKKKIRENSGALHESPLRLLDVGAGMGIFMDLARREGWQVRGVDISPFACRYAKAKLDLEMYCGELTTLNSSVGSFDWITMIDCLEHTTDPLAVLGKARELIAPQGKLFISMPRQDSLVDQLALFFNRITGEKFQAPAKRIYKKEHFFYFTPATIQKALAVCGWEIIAIKGEASIIALTKTNALEKLLIKGLFTLARLLKKENLMLIWAKAK